MRILNCKKRLYVTLPRVISHNSMVTLECPEKNGYKYFGLKTLNYQNACMLTLPRVIGLNILVTLECREENGYKYFWIESIELSKTLVYNTATRAWPQYHGNLEMSKREWL